MVLSHCTECFWPQSALSDYVGLSLINRLVPQSAPLGLKLGHDHVFSCCLQIVLWFLRPGAWCLDLQSIHKETCFNKLARHDTSHQASAAHLSYRNKLN